MRLEFKDFLNKDWTIWKYKALREASKGAAKYAGGYGTPRVPIPTDDEDYAFLSQFHPEVWSQALKWRYNEGLLNASSAREEGDKSYNNISNEAKSISFIIPKRSGGFIKRVYYNAYDGKIYTGLRNLFEKLEKPVKYYDDYKVRSEGNPYNPQTPEGPGLDTISKGGKPWEEYLGGLYDVDLTNPLKINTDLVDELPDDHPWLTRVSDDPQEAREKLKKAPPHSFAGMPVMQQDTASKIIAMWIKSQALGLLGSAKNAKDPITGKKLEINGKTTPYEIYAKWPRQVGRDDGIQWEQKNQGYPIQGAKAQAIKLEVPYTTRQIQYADYDENGNFINSEREEVRIPVLTPGKLFPLITPTEEQRQAIKQRRSANKSTSTDTGQIGDLDKLLQNWDLISDSQKKDFIEGEISLQDVLLKKYVPKKDGSGEIIDVEETDWDEEDVEGEGYEDEIDDVGGGRKSVKGTPFYTMGWTPNKLQRGRVNLNMTKEQLEKVLEEYYPGDSQKLKITNKRWHSDGVCNELGFVDGLLGEACRGVTYFMKHSLGWKGYKANRRSEGPGKFSHPDQKSSILTMMEKALNSIIPTAASLLALNLNHPLMGIWAPEDGLSTLHPELRNDSGAKTAQAWRMQYAYNFARDIAQAGLEGHPSRRQRRKGKGFELQDVPSGEDQDSLIDTLQDTSGEKDRESIEYLRAVAKAEKLRAIPRVWQIPSQEEASRPGWIVPEFSSRLARLLNTKRQEISSMIDSKAGTSLADNVTQIARTMIAVAETQEALADEELKNLQRQGKDLSNLTKKDQEALKARVEELLPDALRKNNPELFGKMGGGAIAELISKANQGGQDDGIWSALDRIIGTQRNALIVYNKNFLNQLLQGKESAMQAVDIGENSPMFWGQYQNYEVPEGVTPQISEEGRYNLAKLTRQIYDSKKYPKNIVDLFQTMGFRKEDADEYAVQLIIKMASLGGQNVSPEDAIALAKELGLDPMQANKAQQSQSQTQQINYDLTKIKEIKKLGDYILAPYNPSEGNEDQLFKKIFTAISKFREEEVMGYLNKWFESLQSKGSNYQWTIKDRVLYRIMDYYE